MKSTILTHLFFAAFLVAISKNIFADENVKSANSNPIKIGIIGAGIGGTSCAYFLKELAPDVSVDIIEMGTVGGRLALIDMAGFQYEAGGSIIHPRNKYMVDLVETLGLNKRTSFSNVDGWQMDRVSLAKEREVFFAESSYTIISLFQMIWRYGIRVLYSANTLISSTLTKFEKIYDILDQGYNWITVKEFLNEMTLESINYDSEAVNDTDISLGEKLTSQSISRQFIDELATAAVRTNYGQMPDDIHAFVGEVALAGAENGLWSVSGGNRKVAELLLKKSEARLVTGEATLITMTKDKKYRITYTPIQDQDVQPHLHNEGSNGGRFASPYQQLEGLEDIREYDFVVLATPMTKDKSSISFSGFPVQLNFPGKFHRTVATFVKGEMNAKFLQLESLDEATSTTLFVDNENVINSWSLLAPVNVPRGKTPADFPLVWKIFSQRALTKEELDDMFAHREETKVIDWLAYPKYSTHMQHHLGNFTLYDGLYHLNAIEWAASAMEMSVIAAKNAANAIHEQLSRKPPREQRSNDFRIKGDL